MKLDITRDQYLEIEKLELGVFSPLTKFMGEEDFHSVVNDLKLTGGEFFPLPVCFNLSQEKYTEIKDAKVWSLFYDGEEVASLEVESTFEVEKEAVAQKIYGTNETKHPGVKHFYSSGEIFVCGTPKLIKKVQFEFSEYEMSPKETKAYFQKMGWKTVAGFQTRNVPHRAHEYLQRVALEVVDGLFIQPLVGKKKEGDFTPDAVMSGYQALIDNYYPKDFVKLAVLSTVMRYAGPREALFHGLIRKNYGCTHFIVGRDHAGVGGYYGKYEAHQLVKKYADQAGITFLTLHGPYYCGKCDSIVTEKTCQHEEGPYADECFQISGTFIREKIVNQEEIDIKFMRPEVFASIDPKTALI